MKLRVLMILFAACALNAQEPPATPPPPNQGQPEAVIIPVKTLTGDAFNRLFRLLKVFDGPGTKYAADSEMRTIVVYAPKDVVTQMRRVIEDLDKPGSEAAMGRNIEMTLTFLRCSARAGTAQGTLPADVEQVAKQLRAATQYKNIELWDVVPLRLQEGREAEQSLRLPGTLMEGRAAVVAGIRIQPEAVGRKGQARYVRFSNLVFNFKIPVSAGTPLGAQYTYQDVSLRTAGDFVEGQKTVLGKVSGADDDSAIFVVIALKVLD